MMAHFAKLNENNFVTEVIVVNNEVITVDGQESEQAGIDFLTNLYGHSLWKQCSYNNNFRHCYPGYGFEWREDLDAFIYPKEYDSWILNETTLKWEAPTPEPNDGKGHYWNEANLSWIEFEIPPARG